MTPLKFWPDGIYLFTWHEEFTTEHGEILVNLRKHRGLSRKGGIEHYLITLAYLSCKIAGIGYTREHVDNISTLLPFQSD